MNAQSTEAPPPATSALAADIQDHGLSAIFPQGSRKGDVGARLRSHATFGPTVIESGTRFRVVA
jgi:hypothetical protein